VVLAAVLRLVVELGTELVLARADRRTASPERQTSSLEAAARQPAQWKLEFQFCRRRADQQLLGLLRNDQVAASPGGDPQTVEHGTCGSLRRRWFA
jgi:hypothetical protein